MTPKQKLVKFIEEHIDDYVTFLKVNAEVISKQKDNKWIENGEIVEKILILPRFELDDCINYNFNEELYGHFPNEATLFKILDMDEYPWNEAFTDFSKYIKE